MSTFSANKRFRSQSGGTLKSSSVFNPIGSTSPLNSQVYTWGSYVDYVTRGQNIPNWKLRIANNESATTSLSGESINRKLRQGHLRRVLQPVPNPFSETLDYDIDGDLTAMDPPSLTASEDQFQTADNRAKINFLNKCREAQTALEGGVILGELGETLRFILSPAKSLRRSTSDYLNNLRKKAKRVRKKARRGFVTDSYLEWMFAVQPLMGDIESGFEALSRYLYHPEPFLRIQARGYSDSATLSTLLDPPNGFHAYFQYQSLTRNAATVKYYGKVRVLKQDLSLPNMRNLGLDIRSFIPTVWEVIPWSFVIDYFVNVGDVLSALSFNQCDLAWYARGLELKATRVASNFKPVPPNPAYKALIDIADYGHSEWVRRRVQRLDLSGIPIVPVLEVRIPGVSSQKWLNIAALARSRSRSFF